MTQNAKYLDLILENNYNKKTIVIKIISTLIAISIVIVNNEKIPNNDSVAYLFFSLLFVSLFTFILIIIQDIIFLLLSKKYNKESFLINRFLKRLSDYDAI